MLTSVARWCEKYTVREDGTVWRGGKMLKATPNKDGYLTVSLCKEGEAKTFYVHDLVAEAFIGPKPEGEQVRHKDGVPGNCLADNLEYGSRSENQMDRMRHGTDCRNEKHGAFRLSSDQVRELRESDETDRQAADRLGVSPSLVNRIRNGKRRVYA